MLSFFIFYMFITNISKVNFTMKWLADVNTSNALSRQSNELVGAEWFTAQSDHTMHVLISCLTSHWHEMNLQICILGNFPHWASSWVALISRIKLESYSRFSLTGHMDLHWMVTKPRSCVSNTWARRRAVSICEKALYTTPKWTEFDSASFECGPHKLTHKALN